MALKQNMLPEDQADKLICLDISVRRTAKKLIRMELRKRTCLRNRKKRLQSDVNDEVKRINSNILALKKKIALQVVQAIVIVDELEKERESK